MLAFARRLVFRRRGDERKRQTRIARDFPGDERDGDDARHGGEREESARASGERVARVRTDGDDGGERRASVRRPDATRASGSRIVDDEQRDVSSRVRARRYSMFERRGVGVLDVHVPRICVLNSRRALERRRARQTRARVPSQVGGR